VSTPDLIPWLDLKRQYRALRLELLDTLDELLEQGSFILGPFVERFEAEFARFVGAAHCVGVNSGTSALHLALLACGVGPGDEVLTTPATWISTCWAISYVGAWPVFVDIEPDTYCLDPDALERAITSRTKAIVPVHLYGQPAAMPAINAVAARYGLAVIEDACQAHGAALHGRRLGTYGQVGCFSFYPAKNLGAFGEAGALVTDDAALAERLRRLRNHAQTRRHVHDELGFNMRMEGIQGAVLSVKLKHLSAWTEARRRIARQYDDAFGDLPGVTVPAERPGALHNRHIYALCCHQRAALREHLAHQGIQSAVHYPRPVHLQPAYHHLGYEAGDFPVAEALCRSQLTLPLFPELTESEIERVCQAVRDGALGRHSSALAVA
jgi:dTDP-4-amino-4,6-dideoxygalactose transaminase